MVPYLQWGIVCSLAFTMPLKLNFLFVFSHIIHFTTPRLQHISTFFIFEKISHLLICESFPSPLSFSLLHGFFPYGFEFSSYLLTNNCYWYIFFIEEILNTRPVVIQKEKKMWSDLLLLLIVERNIGKHKTEGFSREGSDSSKWWGWKGVKQELLQFAAKNTTVVVDNSKIYNFYSSNLWPNLQIFVKNA